MPGDIPDRSKIVASDGIAVTFTIIKFLSVLITFIAFLDWTIGLPSRSKVPHDKKKAITTFADFLLIFAVCLGVFIICKIIVSRRVRRIQEVFRRGAWVTATVVSLKRCRLSFQRYDAEFKIKCIYSIDGSEYRASKRVASNQVNKKKIIPGTQFRLVLNPKKPKKHIFADDILNPDFMDEK